MSDDKLVIPEDRPLAARRVLDILNSGPKLSILKVLLDQGEASAKDIASKVKTKLSTVLSHLSDLVKAGLVKVNVQDLRGKQVKKYSLVSSKLTINIDFRLFLHLEEYAAEEKLKELEYLALKYISVKREKETLPLTISVRDVAKVLNVDINTAIEVTDFINTHTDRIIDYLCSDALDIIKNRGKVKNLREFASLLNVHQYWAALILQSLSSKGFIRIMDDGSITLP